MDRFAQVLDAVLVPVAHYVLDDVALKVPDAIGVDVLATTNPSWADECVALAQDYLGPSVATRLAGLPIRQRATAFATAWTRWEAGLKSGGLGLSEWTLARQDSVDSCHIAWLELPAGYCGAVALRPGPAR